MSNINFIFFTFLHSAICQMFFNKKNYFRYADKISIGKEVLIGENGKLKAVKVKEVFKFSNARYYIFN